MRRRNRIMIGAILGLLALLTLFPFIYMTLLSILPDADAFHTPIKIVPSYIDLGNYLRAMQAMPLIRQLLNSFIFSITCTLLVAFTGVCAAYALTKIDLPGARPIMVFFIATMLFSPPMRAVPTYTFIARLGLLDTWAGMILPFAATGYSIFFLYQFMLTIPRDFIEAARIDGASEAKILYNIAMPMARTAISTICLYNFLFRWRAYIWPLIISQTETKVRPLTVGLGTLRSSEDLIPWNVIGAASMFLFLPSLLLFLLLRRYILHGESMEMK